MKRRYDTAVYDLDTTFKDLQKNLKTGAGVNEGFVEDLTEYLHRVKSLHMQARRGMPHA